MDLVLHSGKIYTGQHLVPVEALGVRGEAITMLGSNQELLPHIKETTKAIDLQGRAVLPGFNDSHMHLLVYGYAQTMMDFTSAKSMEEMATITQDYIKKHKPSPGEWLRGRSWNQDYFQGEKRFPNRYDLDKISTEYPLVFTRACFHIMVVNSKVLELIGLTKDSPQPEGGSFDVDESGEPTGIFRELAQNLVFDQFPSPKKEQIKEMMKIAYGDLSAQGITSVGSDDFQAIPDHDYHKVIAAYKELVAEGEASVRVYEQCLLPSKELLQEFYHQGYQTGQGDYLFKIGPLKLLLDGSLGARTAALREPYSDDPTTCGILTFTQEEVDELVDLAHQNNCQVALHGIGDRAMDVGFEALQKTLAKKPKNDHRHGIVHAQITDETLLHQFVELEALAYIQPIFLDYDWKMAPSRLGVEREMMAYHWKGMYDRGIRASMGSDAPVETFSVMAGIYEAVNRRDLQGNPPQGWLMEQGVSVEQAIKGYTLEGAYASFEENIKGTLDIGKLADMVVLSDNILEIEPMKIKDVQVDYTILGGQVVYER